MQTLIDIINSIPQQTFNPLSFALLCCLLILSIAYRLNLKTVKHQSYERGILETKAELSGFKEKSDVLSWEVDNIQDELAIAKQQINQNLSDILKLTAEKATADEKIKYLTEQQTLFDQQNQENKHSEKDKILLHKKIIFLQTKITEERKQFDEKIHLLKDSREQIKVEFEKLTQQIFQENSEKLIQQNNSNIDTLILPLKEQLQAFNKNISDTYQKQSIDQNNLLNEVKHLKDLNQQISQDAINLTDALQGNNKTQGCWGEVILEKVLECSGLEQGREFQREVVIKEESGKKWRPDVILYLPGNRQVIIDSKVSLTAYSKYFNEADSFEKDKAMKQHINSIKSHIHGLGKKFYQNASDINSLDYVIIFIPIESALTLALESDADLYQDAYQHNIILASPFTLLAILRTIHNLWRNEKQNENAKEIAKKAGALYDKCIAFFEDLEDVGDKINQSQNAYSNAFNKLSKGRGNIVTRVKELKTLGAITQKKLPDSLSNIEQLHNCEVENPRRLSETPDFRQIKA
jgi:DNA recombination protein RmuC